MGMMMGEWPKKPLSDLAELESPITYGVVKPGSDPPDGVLFIRGGDIANGRIDVAALRRISTDISEQYRRTLLRGGELIISLVGNPGQIALVPESLCGANIARQVGLVRLGADVDSGFVKYFLLSREGQNALGAHSIGSVQQVINLRDLKTVEIPTPPLPEQRAIASVLGSLDDKIELNRRMNRTLEAMAAAIFKAWFVDFEPVRAKASGAASFPGMPQPAFDALPTAFTNSQLGPIPEGWEVMPLKEAARLTMGQSPKSEFYNTTGDGLPFHQGVTNYGERFPIHKTFCTIRNRIAEKGDILFSVRAPVGRINVADERLIVGRGVAAIRHHNNWQSYLLYALKYQFTEEDSIGDGTIFKAVTKKDMEGIQLIEPCEVVGQGYERIASAIDQQIGLNDRESRTLAEIRDALLPKLLSGEVRVIEAERILA
jgi:type I restriction enzyme, S subunit